MEEHTEGRGGPFYIQRHRLVWITCLVPVLSPSKDEMDKTVGSLVLPLTLALGDCDCSDFYPSSPS
jgi:hypothetical protein